jgi:hypothetical protein
MAADTTLTVNADTSGAIRNVKALESAFNSLKTQLLGLGIGTAILQANQFALALDQASRASGVALGTVTSFSKAVASLGGDAGRAAGDIIDFVAGLDAAKQGSASAQIALQKVGVSLGELGSSTNEQLFRNTVKGIAAIGDASTRNRLAVQLLGRSFKDIDVRDVAAKLNAGGGTDTGAISSAAAAQKNISENFGKLQEALLNVLKPLNDIAASVNVTTQTFEKLITAVIAVGAAFLTFTYAGKIFTLLRVAVVGLYQAFGAIVTAASSLGSFLKELAGGMGALWRATEGAGGMFTRLYIVIETVAKFIGSLLAPAIAALAPLWKPFAIAGAAALGYLSETLDGLITNTQKFITAITFGAVKFNQAGAGRGGNASTLADQKARGEELRKQSELEAAARQKVVDAFRNQGLEQQKIISNYKQSNADSIRQLEFQNSLIGKTEEESQKKTKLFEMETAYIKQINDILTKQEEMKRAARVGTDEEIAAYNAYSAGVQKTITALAEQYGIQLEAGGKLIDRGQGLQLLEKDRENTLTRITEQMETQARINEALTAARTKIGSDTQDLTFQRGLIGFGNLTKQRLTIVEESRKAGNEAARAYAAAFEGEDITAGQAQQFADGLTAIEEGYAEIRDMQLSNLAASQEWSAGWREAFQNYADDAENTAKQAADYFATFSKGWEDAIVKFVQTGKLSFKDLANSMIAEFARMQAQKMFVQLFGGAGNAGGGILGSFFGGLFGKAGGGAVMAGKPYMVGESGSELFVPNSAGRIIPNGQLGGGGAVNVNYNIQAVDAASFRSLVARDPSFIYAVTEQGRRSQPSRSR